MVRKNAEYVITPDSFSLSPAIMGLPLARPSRRLAAMLLDLLLVAVLVNLGGILLAVAAAYVAFRLAARVAPRSGGFLARGTRVGIRAFASIVLFVVALNLWSDAEDWADGFDVDVQQSAAGTTITGGVNALRVTPEAPARVQDVALRTDSLAAAYAAAVAAGDTSAARRVAPVLGVTLAKDTLGRMGESISELRNELREAESALERHRNEGLVSRIKGWLDDLGIGFGWSGLYFTAFLALWKGQTPGKRLLGIRVVRLNGEPMTLWTGFERFGGYAAGLVTGLLGFAQVFWDRNRQMIHDKIVETVVVREKR